MKLWGGRFTKETNELVNSFNASISFDQKFYKEDIEGSVAHVTKRNQLFQGLTVYLTTLYQEILK